MHTSNIPGNNSWSDPEYLSIPFTVTATGGGPHQWWTFSDYHSMVMSGGNNNKMIITVELALDQLSLNLGDLPSLPKKKIGHCLVALSGSDLFVTGKIFFYFTLLP